jgi:hypothetical protein
MMNSKSKVGNPNGGADVAAMYTPQPYFHDTQSFVPFHAFLELDLGF